MGGGAQINPDLERL
jgi:DNA replication licensing factor MCM3